MNAPVTASAARFLNVGVFAAGGACKAVKTTPLLTAEEAVEAMKKAAGSEYRAAIRVLSGKNLSVCQRVRRWNESGFRESVSRGDRPGDE
jgi:hypothetical protein